jgi:hypothetical protein
MLHWHDLPYSEFFNTHARSFAHLCLGDPGRGSTGIHELGFNPIKSSPLRKGIIPTLTIVDDTIEQVAGGVSSIIEDAKKYISL